MSEILPNLKLAISWNHIKTDFIYKLKKSRVKFDDVNFLLSPVETAITSRRQTEFESMYTDFFLIMEFACLRLYQQMKKNLKTRAWNWCLENTKCSLGNLLTYNRWKVVHRRWRLRQKGKNSSQFIYQEQDRNFEHSNSSLFQYTKLSSQTSSVANSVGNMSSKVNGLTL